MIQVLVLWLLWVKHTESGQPATHRWTVSGRSGGGVAVSCSLSLCYSALCGLCYRHSAFRCDHQHHLQLSLICEAKGVKEEKAESLLSNRQKKDELWKEALLRLQWRWGRRIKGGNGNVSFIWRPVEGAFMLGLRFPPSVGNREKIRVGFGGWEIDWHHCWYLKQIKDNLLTKFWEARGNHCSVISKTPSRI